MTKIIIFGGTTEGRELAEFCHKAGIHALVCVVSSYGHQVLRESNYVKIRQGAMGEAEMERLFQEERPMMIVDGTHPYASTVTAALRLISDKLKITYIRVIREAQSMNASFSIIPVADIKEAVTVLESNQKPVLVTTGSKELHQFTKLKNYEDRLYARVLPDGGVIAACEALGVLGKHIIAMQGPFSIELNQGIINQIGAGWLVTKDSGKHGGFEEKIEAAIRCNIPVIVIGRPKEEDGVSLEIIKQTLQKYGTQKRRSLHLIGVGMGGGSQLTQEAIGALCHCEAVVGAPRLLSDVSHLIQNRKTEAIYLGHEILSWADAHSQYKTIGVLYSGDTGFYSGSSSLFAALKEGGESHWEVKIYPGISTLSCLCARLHTSWEHIYAGSLHGRSDDIESLLKTQTRIFLLLGGEEPLKALCGQIQKAGFENAWIWAGEQLGYPNERVFGGTAKEMEQESTGSLVAVLIEVNGHER